MRFFAVFVLLTTLSACSQQTESPQMTGTSPDNAVPGESETAASDEVAPSNSPAPDAVPMSLPSGGPALTDPQIKRLFASIWVADKDATIAFAENASNTELETAPSTFAVPLSYEGAFKEAGFLAKSKMLREPQMFEIDYASPDAANIIRVLDDTRFALNVGPCWVVFSERQAAP